jgi:hypothetical protein
MTAESELKKTLDPANFPRWAQACPKSFADMQQSILRAAVQMGQLNINAGKRAELSKIIGMVAAISWAAGRASVEEGRANGLTEMPS